MPAIKPLKIMFWNAQSINSSTKKHLIELFMESEKIDILLLAETFLKPHIPFQMKNFTVHRNDRQQQHGGVAIAIRSSINHKLVKPFNTQHIETLTIEILVNGKPTKISVAYSPKASIHFKNDLQKMTNLSEEFMIFGDFNAHHPSWNCRHMNKSGKSLYELQQNSDFIIYNTSDHTHYPHSGRTPSTIDLLLSNSSINFNLITHHDHFLSDHAPIIFSTNSNVQHTQQKIYDYAKANWKQYRHIINDKINGFSVPNTTAGIDIALEKFTELIQITKLKCVPIKSSKIYSSITEHTKQLIRDKNAAKRRWQRCMNEHEKRQLKSELNCLQIAVDCSVRNDYNESMAKHIKQFTKGSKSMWQLTKRMKGKTDNNATKIKIEGCPTIDDNDRANHVAKIFEKSHKITSGYKHTNDTEVKQRVNSFHAFSRFSCQPSQIEIIEIQQIIRSLKPFKAPGPDSIQNVLLKNLPNSAIAWLTNIFNKCFSLSYWPKSFKIAKVIPILKAGKPPTDASSYRPISLLNATGKLLEKVLQKRLINFVEEKNLLPNFQFGFRRGHSTIHQAARIKQFIIRNKRNKKSTGMVLLDIEKAFDSIWHDGMIYKLIKLKIPSYLIRLIDSFIRDRQFNVHINQGVSESIKIPAGLAQGTCISPILYALYVADIPKFNDTEIALYADDTALYTAAKTSNTIVKRLNLSLQTLRIYFRKWKIKINNNKTQAILFPFDNKRRRTPTTSINCGRNIINFDSSVGYLGITFDKKLTFKEHISNATNKATKCFRAMYTLLAPKSHLSTVNKHLIYTSIIRPIFAYGSPIWSTAAACHLRNVSILQNKIIKTIYKLPRRTATIFLKQITGIPTVYEYIQTTNNTFITNCRSSIYNAINEIDCL
jgi:Reverse transcriptase (RNA-dependent DNA polymerase)/Endonuclease-reverse transcriptase